MTFNPKMFTSLTVLISEFAMESLSSKLNIVRSHLVTRKNWKT